MSLVGPRPHPLDDFSAYTIEDLPRLDVTPGMTGLWQVTARRDRSFQAGMKLDIEYIDRWSLGMDLRILPENSGRGAARERGVTALGFLGRDESRTVCWAGGHCLARARRWGFVRCRR